MTKNVSNAFITEKNKQTNKPIVLFELIDYDGQGNDLYLAKYDQDIVFNGKTYLQFGITFATIDENAQGQVDAVRITVLNVSRYMQAQLESHDLREKKVVVKIVWLNHLSDPTCYLDHVYYIDMYSANQGSVEFTCTTKMDVIEKMLPSGIYLRTHCRYKRFKDSQTCGYNGSETTCNRTMQKCKELGNFKRFGGFPSLPVRRLYVV